MTSPPPRSSLLDPARPIGRPHVAAGATEEPAPPAWGTIFVLFYVMVAVGRIHETLPVLAPLRIGLVSGAVALALWVLGPGTLAEKVLWPAKATQYVLVILALAVLTVPVAVWPGGSATYLTQRFVKTLLLFFLVIYYCRSLRDIRRVLLLVTLTAALMVASGVLTGSIHDRHRYGEGTYDANDLAMVLVVTVPLAMYLLTTSRPLGRVVQALIMLTCLYGVVLTQSRGGFLALVAVGSLILVRSALSRKQKILITLLGTVVFTGLAGPSYWERIRTIWEPQTEYDRTAGGRTEVWQTGLVLMATRPWGAGINGFEVAEGLSHGGRGKWSASHNSFLQIGVDLGIAGLTVFVLLLRGTLRSLRDIQRAAQHAGKPSCVPLLARRVEGAARGGKGIPPRRPPPLVHHEIVLLASALEISVWGFIVAGFFLSQAYGSMLYVLLAAGLICVRLAAAQGLAPDPLASPRAPLGRRSPWTAKDPVHANPFEPGRLGGGR